MFHSLVQGYMKETSFPQYVGQPVRWRHRKERIIDGGERGESGGSEGERGGGMSRLGMLGERGGEGWRGEQFGYAG
jgi:hypothetical protein